MTSNHNSPPLEEKITPEMIEAGVRALQESGAIPYEMNCPDRALVKEIFEEMIKASRAP